MDAVSDFPDEPEFGGVVVPRGGQLRLSGLQLDSVGAVSLDHYDLRWDIWPEWLGIAQTELALAEAARATNPGAGSNFGDALHVELRHAMTSVCAVAFALEAFTNSVVYHQPHTAEGFASDAEVGAASRMSQVWVRAFKLDNGSSKSTNTTLHEVFDFRNAGVHSSAGFTEPHIHPVFPFAVEARFARFRSRERSDCGRLRHVDHCATLRSPSRG